MFQVENILWSIKSLHSLDLVCDNEKVFKLWLKETEVYFNQSKILILPQTKHIQMRTLSHII